MDEVTKQYNERAKRILRAQMAAKGLNFDGLSQALAEIGHQESAKNLSNKIGRGTFTAGFFMMCLEAMRYEIVRLSDV